MTSPKTPRDPVQDHLLTPQNSALIIIDYQPVQVTSVASMDRRTLVTNIVAVTRTAKLYGLPIVLSTVNVKTGINQPTIHQLRDLLSGVESLDRTTINAWEDAEFLKAVKASGRKKTDHGGAVDRGLPNLSGVGRSSRRVRGLSGGRCCRRHFGGSPSRSIGTYHSSLRVAA